MRLGRFSTCAVVGASTIVVVFEGIASAAAIERQGNGQIDRAEHGNASRSGFSPFTEPPLGLAVSLSGGVATVAPEAQARALVGPSLPGGFLAFRLGVLRFLYTELGLGGAEADDRAPFDQAVCGIYTGECGPASSSSGGLMLSAEIGGLFRVLAPIADNAIQLTVLGGLGHRGFHATRQIAQCSGCRSEAIDVDGGLFLSPAAELSYVLGGHAEQLSAIGARGKYEHYLTGDISKAIWLGVFFEFETN